MAGKVTNRITINRLGKAQEWTLTDDVFKGQPNMRRAYVRGFRQRARDFNQGIKPVTLASLSASKAQTVGDAFACGYLDALEQETGGQ